MEFFLNQHRQLYLGHLSGKLAKLYEVDENEARKLVSTEKIHKRVPDDEDGNKKCQCQARTWNKGYGARCSKNAKAGSDFCLVHGMIRHLKLCKSCTKDMSKGKKECINVYHKYAWECLGRHDGPIPTHKFVKYKSEKFLDLQ